MDRKSSLGFIMIIMVSLLWMLNTQPSKEESKNQLVTQDTTAVETSELPVVDDPVRDENAESENASIGEISEPDSTEKFEKLASYESMGNSLAKEGVEPIVIENDKVRIEIDPNGGMIQRAQVKDYTTYDSLPVVLTDENDVMDISFLQRDGTKGSLKFSEFYFEPSKQGFNIDENGSDALILTYANTSGGNVEIEYALKGGSYNVEMDIRTNDMQESISSSQPLRFFWSVTGKGREKSIDTEKSQYTHLYYKYKNEDSDDFTGDDIVEVDKTLEWAAFKQYFFSAIVYADGGFKSDYGDLETKDLDATEKGLTYEFTAKNLAIPMNSFADGNAHLEFYFGPNHMPTLDQYERGYGEVIQYGWGIFGWMNKNVVIPIFNWLSKGIQSYGLIILILTVIIKLALSPLTYKNYLSSAKQKVLKPEIEEINKKHKDGDAMKKQQAMMALYKKTGVNPMAGCIPMIIQLPILYAMFRFFPSSIELRQQSFLWADDLSAYDSIFELPFSIPAYGDHVSLFTLLMALSTMLYTRMNSSQMTMPSQPGMPNMKFIMYLFPVMMLLFFNNFASGLSYYYLLANLFSMGQMYVIKNYVIDEDKIRKQIASNKKKPKKQSRFQKRLEQMAKERGMQMPKR
ncbi:MAG: membrane protein insertase YidC [Bacteroidota bacterium]